MLATHRSSGTLRNGRDVRKQLCVLTLTQISHRWQLFLKARYTCENETDSFWKSTVKHPVRLKI